MSMFDSFDHPPPNRVHALRLKRAIDVGVSLLVITGAAPLFLAQYVFIALLLRERPIIAERRIGREGRPFRLYRFNAAEREAALTARRDVDRCEASPLVRGTLALLRRSGLDELPNFINVLLGEMSVVGPRPPLPEEVCGYADYFARRRLTVRPGVTCLWQASAADEDSFERWVWSDNEYIDTWSPPRDLAIMFATIPAVIRRIPPGSEARNGRSHAPCGIRRPTRI